MSDKILNDILGNIILFGILVAYLFQYIKIVKAKTSNGISHLFLAIGYISSIVSLGNAIIFYYPEWVDCRGLMDCNSKTIGFIQIFSQCCCFVIFYLIYIIYSDNNITVCRSITSKYAKWITFSVMTLILIGIILLSIFLAHRDIKLISFSSSSGDNAILSTGIKTYAGILSLFGIITSCIQYLPQISRTYIDKFPGSLV
jgi:hypothetical protein